jgi:MFS family permease
VAAGFLVLFVVYGLQFSFGEFRLAATEEEGWSQTSLSLIFAVYIGAYSVLSAVSGWATDRFGPRVTVAVGSVLLCAGYALWAGARTLWAVAVALAVIAPIGMSCSWVPVNATAVRWFVKRRGIAGAVVTSGGSVGNIVAPPVAASLVAAHGWRTALLVMASAGLVLLLVAAAILVRDPESVGLHPDGADEPPVVGQLEVSVSPGDAVRSSTFWTLWAMYSLTFIVVFVPFVHGSAHAVDLGISKIVAATVISSIGVGGLTGRLLVGSVSDRIDRRRAVVYSLALETVAFLGLAVAQDLWLLYPAAVAFGFSYGGAVAVFPALVGDYFGRAHVGAIVGRMFASAGAMAAIGPYVAAVIFDATGSYRMAFVVSAVLNGLAFLLATRLPTPAVGRPGGAGFAGPERGRPADGGQGSVGPSARHG